MNRNTAIAIAIAVLTVVSANAADKVVDRSFTVSANASLIVDADSASVHVSGGDGSQVKVHMIARGSEDNLATAKIDAVQKGDEISVTMRTPGKMGWFGQSWHGDAQIEVTVPRNARVNVHTSGGNIDLANTGGFATLNTSGGDISARNFNGTLEARTSGGGIHADDVHGDVDADTSGGSVRLLHVDGKITGKTSGGDVECSLVGANRGITASTSGGSIRLILPRATTGNLEAKTSGGEFKSDLPVTMTEMHEGHVRGSLNGGGQPIEAHTSGGDISLRASD